MRPCHFRRLPPATDALSSLRAPPARGFRLTESARGLTRVFMYEVVCATPEHGPRAVMPVMVRCRAYVVQRAGARVARPARRTAGTIRWSDFPISTGGGD